MKIRKRYLLGTAAVIILVLCLGHGEKKEPAAVQAGCTARQHQHSESCFTDSVSPCCGMGVQIIHTHQEICYDGNGNLRCSLPQVYSHTHGRDCYTPKETDNGRWILWKQVLICRIPEIRAHSHVDTCFREGRWVCGQLQITEHIHSEVCFINSQEASGLSGRDWLGLGEVPISPFTVAGLVQMGSALILLYLQKIGDRKKSLPQP